MGSCTQAARHRSAAVGDAALSRSHTRLRQHKHEAVSRRPRAWKQVRISSAYFDISVSIMNRREISW
jgi:hypothetical protein